RMKMVFKKYRAEPKDCVFITDTLGDIREAASLGVKSIGVSWGFQEKGNLLKGKPISIAEKPKDLLNIVSACFK
ncbi:MAG: HAD hydrolase-like protein, partial [bacterium]